MVEDARMLHRTRRISVAMVYSFEMLIVSADTAGFVPRSMLNCAGSRVGFDGIFVAYGGGTQVSKVCEVSILAVT